MPKPELEFHLPQAQWQPAAGPAGIESQVLAEDPETGGRTLLTRFAPGTDTSAHGPVRHAYWEEVYLLEGDLTDLRLGETFTAGMYACRPPGMKHGPWSTQAGALMLEIRVPG